MVYTFLHEQVEWCGCTNEVSVGTGVNAKTIQTCCLHPTFSRHNPLPSRITVAGKEPLKTRSRQSLRVASSNVEEKLLPRT